MGKKILVVDDENFFVDIIKVRLESAGHEVITAENGREALKKIKDDKPDIVFLDIVMPELDGLEVLKRVRESDETLPVYMITAYFTEDKRAEAMRLGATGFFAKDIDIKKEVEKILGKKELP